MLTNRCEQSDLSEATPEVEKDRNNSRKNIGLLIRALRLEWLGQMFASLCWFASVMAYGINSTGDWLQLFAASAWFLANVAAVIAVEG